MSEREPTIEQDMKWVAECLLFYRDGQDAFERIQAHVEALEGALREIITEPAEYEVNGECGYCNSKSIARAALAGETEEVRHG